ncbi:MAG: 50S ribosomal protein L22 [Candidatus Buchananbacteria bacterium RBG_13_36_9]|uniref:Large ribosomal subunit protein uL22 n=1 Tax=Candidatus Buchananbacteria bacterium RBG_13_36_9 TaxID=1797530 RepID=A0A1G1XML2_9BACT|nr:MAG: 50S ribosomal protein L22 [Candidatus Buchananbacteria bacterium RBG_13_36_9]
MLVNAKLRYLRMSPKKVRLVINLIRGLKVEEAINQLNFLNKLAKRPVLKLLNSAISNAENNFSLKRNNLFIKEIRVDEAGRLKRWQPKAHGRATPIHKKMSHVIIVLDELVPTKAKAKLKAKAPKAVKPLKVSSLEEIKKAPLSEKVQAKKESVPKEHEKEIDKEIVDVRMEGKHRHKQQEEKRLMKKSKGFIKKIFSRKAG